MCGLLYSCSAEPVTEALAQHLVAEAEASDVQHVMWLNRNVTKHRVPVEELTALLRQRDAGGSMPDDRVPR